MGRMRTMKPEFFKSRSLAKLPRDARTTFAGLWTEADDFGNGIADERLLKGAIWPLDDDIEPLHVSAFLRMLAASNHIRLYTVGDETYFHIINFTKHQSAAYRRGEPKFPGPDAGQDIDPDPAPERMQESAERTPESAVTRNEERGTGNEEKDLATAVAVKDPDLFDEFWANYPRKDNKAQARKAWPKACKRLEPERLVKAAAFWARLWEDVGKDREHIPHASTWLNNDRWNDERPVRPRAAPNSTDAHFAALLTKPGPESELRLLPGGA